MRAITIASAAAILAALSACGGNKITRDGKEDVRVTALTIAPATTMLKIKGSETFTAAATMSDGSTSTVTPTWRTSNPAIATVDASGKVTAAASGSTVITAEYLGAQATRDLRVVPDYHGTWNGRVNVVSCTTEGDWTSTTFCADLGTGDVDSISLTASQQSAAITGTLDLGGLAGAITGTVAGDGTLSVAGDYTAAAGGFAFKIGVVDWQSVTTDNSRMTGRFGFTVRNDLMTGMARVQSELLNMNKMSSAALAGMRTGEGRLLASMRAAAKRH